MSAILLGLFLARLTHAEPDYVRIKPGADLYSMREMATGERSGSWMPWNSWREHCRSTGARGERVLDQNGVTVLRIDIRNSGCGYFFRAFDEDFDRVFVKSDQVETDDADDRTEAGTREPGCPECHQPDGAMNDFAKITLAAMTNAKAVTLRHPEKTPAELEAYLNCYRTENHEQYVRLYRKLAEIVGKSAQITYTPGAKVEVEVMRDPERLQAKLDRNDGAIWMQAKPSALKCVALRESKFDAAAEGKKDKNGAFALGLGQQRQVAVREMNCALNGCVLKNRKTGRNERVKAKPWVRDIWANVFKNARQNFSAAEYRELMTNARTGQPCVPAMEIQERDAACPINSLATLAVAQLEGALTIRRADGRFGADDVEDYGGRQAFDLTVATATSNQAGRRTTAKAVSSTSDTSQWTDALSTSKESISNSAALIACLQGGNYNPPWTMKAGEEPRDCSRQRRAAAE